MSHIKNAYDLMQERKRLKKCLFEEIRNHDPKDEFTIVSKGIFLTESGEYVEKEYTRVTTPTEEKLRQQINILKMDLNGVSGHRH